MTCLYLADVLALQLKKLTMSSSNSTGGLHLSPSWPCKGVVVATVFLYFDVQLKTVWRLAVQCVQCVQCESDANIPTHACYLPEFRSNFTFVMIASRSPSVALVLHCKRSVRCAQEHNGYRTWTLHMRLRVKSHPRHPRHPRLGISFHARLGRFVFKSNYQD